MNIAGDERNTGSEDAYELLLRQASPRPSPPQRFEKQVRGAVHAQWRKTTRTRRTRRRLTVFGLAATVLLAAFVWLDAYRVSETSVVHVATISKSSGAIYLLGQNSERSDMSEVMAVSAGQTVVTNSGSGVALEWLNGGSLRIDENSRVTFLSTGEIYLQSGRVYFDSEPFVLVASSNEDALRTLKIVTDHGLVTHSCTQFMTFVDANRLSVSVRQGDVTIDGDYFDRTIGGGQKLTYTGSGRPSTVNINRFGEDWAWAERVSPTPGIDGRTVYEFLLWVSHETGLELEFDTPDTEQTARSEILHGTISAHPTSALRIWMMSLDFDWRIENGVIFISESQTATSQ